MSANTTIRAAIKAIMDNISGIGLVHEYERYASKAGAIKDFYVKDGKLAGWHIRRVTFTETLLGNRRYEVATTWSLRGFYAIDDGNASEIVFDAQIDTIATALRSAPSLDSAGTQAVVQDGIQLVSSQPVMFAGVLCHSAIIQFVTKHREQR